MSSLENLTILEIREKLLKKEISSQEITSYYLSQIEKKDKDINAYIINTKFLSKGEASNG